MISTASIPTCAGMQCLHKNRITLSLEDIAKYNGDDATKKALRLLKSSRGNLPIVTKVSDISFVVLGFPSTNNTLGYCHVKIVDDVLTCTSKDSHCKSFVLKGNTNEPETFACICTQFSALERTSDATALQQWKRTMMGDAT